MNDRQAKSGTNNRTRPYADSLRRLRRAGLRPTAQRLALANLLFGDGEPRHVTAEGLHEQALRSDAKVSLATVYNTLHQFVRVGLLREVVVDSGKTFFDTNTNEHHHIYMEEEGSLSDLDARHVRFSQLPEAPEGTRIRSIDVIVRVERDE